MRLTPERLKLIKDTQLILMLYDLQEQIDQNSSKLEECDKARKRVTKLHKSIKNLNKWLRGK